MRHAGLFLAVGLAPLLASAGCGSDAVLHRRAEVACEAVTAAATSRQGRTAEPSDARAGVTGDAPSHLVPTQTLLLAPRAEAADAPADASAGAPADEPHAAMPAIRGRSTKDVLVEDLKSIPSGIGRGLKHTWAKPENLIILGTAFGADRIVRHNWDGEIRDELRYDDTSLAETDDFGTIIGNPALHFGVAGAWYLTSLHKQDQGHYEKSRTMIQALMVNGLSTMLLKVSMDDETPNDEEWGWPSGHTSSSMCFAAVMHEYYGWKAGAPLYLLAGYSAATRLEDREHDLSDLVFGAALGFVVGHSVVQGELPNVAGFHMLPYGGRDAGGLMFVKQW